MREHIDKINKKPAMWIGIVSAVFVLTLGVYGFLGAHIFNEVEAAPKTYETKEDHNIDIDRIEKGQDRIEDKIDSGFKEIRKMILDLHK